MSLTFEFSSSINQLSAGDWDQIAAKYNPFVRYHFLSALEESASVSAATGWQPQHMLIYQNKQLIGILPLYIKSHSYGEYVFDFSWADAYQQHGLNYYPKLVTAIPFTPVTGSRLLLAEHISFDDVIEPVCAAIKQRANSLGLSSIHWLFVDKSLSAQLQSQGFLPRQAVQFQWFNQNYTSFDQFLGRFASRKRKNLKKERAKVHQAGLSIKRLSGNQIRQQDMDFFYRCYQQTYLKRSGHKGYLQQTFFSQLLNTMTDNILLVIAYHDQNPVAGAFYLYDQNQLCGRYWGALEEFDGLHFECCYYQGIEFCIEQKITSFNPGTQGEHKILRGFEPIYCHSNHYLAAEDFHAAVKRFLEQESPQIARYKQQAETLLPFKSE